MRIFESLDVWEICALIAGGSAYVGTSLHGRLVAESFGVPALSLEREPGSARKLRAYLATWSPGHAPLCPEAFAAGAFAFPAYPRRAGPTDLVAHVVLVPKRRRHIDAQ